eukprot:CAMPEP_0172814072 /NCGR_PEP_ID=MMETSP1075-20121228/11043_1 /TAXON_ID=2916 /ORGANISM="Ceratium fusus, Strain PA161109" /LENGTH=1452 /DNA_ID=CAMNT_0013653855 /DNA_START=169 /DNA_END=4524 /DNA_ORIENTATION=+
MNGLPSAGAEDTCMNLEVMEKRVQFWTAEEVCAWLGSIGLGKFVAAFEARNVGGSALFGMNAKDLTELGVLPIGDRRRLLRELDALRKEEQTSFHPKRQVAVLGASPLVHISGCADNQKVVPLETIDFQREQDLLLSTVRNSESFVPGGVELNFTVGTIEAFLEVLRMGVVVLTITGHTTPDGRMLLETTTGEAAEFAPGEVLPRLLAEQPAQSGVGATPGNLPLCIVLSSCYSRQAAQAFLRLGTRHVVAVERTATVLDKAARIFNATFHHALLVGNSVASAFRFAVWEVRNAPNMPASEANKFMLLPEDEGTRHDVALFEPSPRHAATPHTLLRAGDGAPTLTAGNYRGDRLQPADTRLVGRQCDMWRLIRALHNTPCVAVCGLGGVGKTLLCQAAAAYLQARGRQYCAGGVHTICFGGVRKAQVARARLEQFTVASASNCINAISTPLCQVQSQPNRVPTSGDLLLVLTGMEELLQFDAQQTLRLLNELLESTPQLRMLLSSRRTLDAKLWPAGSSTQPHNLILRSLDVESAARLLLQMAPTLGNRRAEEIASVCGHLPLALRVVGQRLAVASDPISEAAEFAVEAHRSLEKRVSLLFSQCVAPHVREVLDSMPRAALTALSLFNNDFDSQGAGAVLGLPEVHVEALLRDLQEQCLIEELRQGWWSIPTPVRLLVQCGLADQGNVPSVLRCSPGATEAELDVIEASARFALHILKLLHTMAHDSAFDRGRSGASLEVLRSFEKHHADIDMSLLIAGTSDIFVAMVQLGRDIFETLLPAQQRVEIYERLLGLLLSNATAGATGISVNASTVDQALEQKSNTTCRTSTATCTDSLSQPQQAETQSVVELRRTQSEPSAPGCSVTGSADGCCWPLLLDGSNQPPAGVDSLDTAERASSVGMVLPSARPVDGIDLVLADKLFGDCKHSPIVMGNVQSQGLPQGKPSDQLLAVSAPEDGKSNADVGTAAAAGYHEGKVVANGPIEENLRTEGSVGAGATAFLPPWWPRLAPEHNVFIHQRLEEILLAGTGNIDGNIALWHSDLGRQSVLLEVLLRLGLAYCALGQYGRATRLLRKALAAAGVAHPLKDPGVSNEGGFVHVPEAATRVELLATLSTALCRQGLWRDAQGPLLQACQLAQHAGSHELPTRLTCDLAEYNHKYKGNLKCAAEFYREGLNQRVKMLGLDHLDTATTLNAIGIFAAQRGSFREARDHIAKAIMIRSKLLGCRHMSVAEALHNLAGVQDALQEYAKAEQSYEHALQIKRRFLPESQISIAETQNNLAVLYSKQQKHERCVGVLRQCLKLCMDTAGEGNPSTAAVLMNLGHALHSSASAGQADSSSPAFLAKLDEALKILRWALRVRTKLFHKRHPCIAPCLANLGYAHYKRGNLVAAERQFSSALGICRKHYGNGHSDEATWLYWLGKTRILAGRTAEAAQDLQAALQLSRLLAGDLRRG